MTKEQKYKRVKVLSCIASFHCLEFSLSKSPQHLAIVTFALNASLHLSEIMDLSKPTPKQPLGSINHNNKKEVITNSKGEVI